MTEDTAALRGDVILSGLVLARRPVPAQLAVAGADDLDLAEPAPELPEFMLEAGRAAVAWAHRRALGLSSACGIWVALAVCAATWFSAGTRSGNVRAAAALWAGYLVLLAGRLLVRAAEPVGTQACPQIADAAVTLPPSDFRRPTAADRRLAAPAGWLAALGTSLGESVVYVGLALGAVADHWPDVWTLALAVLGFSAVRNLMTACSAAPGIGDEPDGLLRRLSGAVVTMPVGGRMLLVGVVAPIWGTRAALLALLDWAIISVGYGLAGRARPELAEAADSGDETGPDQPHQPSRPVEPNQPDQPHQPSRLVEPNQPDQPSRLVRLRDDGVLARGLGSLVRGGLLPLPPAVLAMVAIAALSGVGMHLAGALTIGPAVVMLLAAPGSGHPHDGRFDWLVPVLLLASQLLCLAATGRAADVPGPVIFALLAVLALWYLDLASPERPVLLTRPRSAAARPAERGTGLGWEGRLLLAGFGAAIGIATVTYLALTAYLGMLICLKVVTSRHPPQEEPRP